MKYLSLILLILTVVSANAQSRCFRTSYGDFSICAASVDFQSRFTIYHSLSIRYSNGVTLPLITMNGTVDRNSNHSPDLWLTANGLCLMLSKGLNGFDRMDSTGENSKGTFILFDQNLMITLVTTYDNRGTVKIPGRGTSYTGSKIEQLRCTKHPIFY